MTLFYIVAIEQFLPENQLAITKIAEESERNYLLRVAEITNNRGT
jgi:hypothetical protein